MQVPTLLTKKEAFESLETRKTFHKYNFIYFVTRSRGQKVHKVFLAKHQQLFSKSVAAGVCGHPRLVLYIIILLSFCFLELQISCTFDAHIDDFIVSPYEVLENEL